MDVELPEKNSEGSEIETVHVIILGRVQGVSFRSNLKRRADQVDVKGWTRNLSDGSVEAVLQGEKSKVKEVLEWCRNGPKLARVNSVRESRIDPKTIYRNFVVLI